MTKAFDFELQLRESLRLLKKGLKSYHSLDTHARDDDGFLKVHPSLLFSKKETILDMIDKVLDEHRIGADLAEHSNEE